MEKQKGFTLIELVIVIIILGILAAIAVPRYLDLTTQATDSAKLGMEGTVKSSFAISIADLKRSPTVDELNGYLATDNTTAVPTGIQFALDGTNYTVQTYTDNACTTATAAVGDTVQCVGGVTP
jgi:MSHA pilin protein MshA